MAALEEGKWYKISKVENQENPSDLLVGKYVGRRFFVDGNFQFEAHVFRRLKQVVGGHNLVNAPAPEQFTISVGGEDEYRIVPLDVEGNEPVHIGGRRRKYRTRRRTASRSKRRTTTRRGRRN
jgi:hypothetical protein